MAKSVKNLAWFNNSRIDDVVIEFKPFPSRHDEATMTHKSEMLREICLWELGNREQILNRCLRNLEYIQNLKSL
jgi:hypothetical protein